MSSGMLDQDAAHQSGCETEEVRPVLPMRIPLVDELKVGLVDEGGSLQGVIGPLTTPIAAGQPMQLVIDDRRQFGQGLLVALAPSQEQLSHMWRTSSCSVFFCGGLHF